jgi:hypothetical protein
MIIYLKIAILLNLVLVGLVKSSLPIFHKNKKIQKIRSIPNNFFLNENTEDLYRNELANSRRGPRYFCRGKEDDSQHEHSENCYKYWHCLYVDTIFEIALERNCPIGTMFHPILKQCEISTMVNEYSMIFLKIFLIKSFLFLNEKNL